MHKLRLPDVSNAWVSQPCLLLSLLPNLTTLTLDSLKHDDLALAAACVSGIEHLTISRVECSDEAVRDLLGALPKLRSFVFRGDPGKHLSASFFSGIVHHISPTLESFCFGPWDWDSCFEPEMGFALNDAHLATLTTRLEKLSKLVLRCCRELTDASVGPALAKFEDLVYLDLMYCENVGDAAIAEFKGAGLVALLLGETNASDESLVPVLKANHGLVRVDLDYTAAGVSGLREL